MQRVYRPQINPGQQDEWVAVPVPIPAVPASELLHCNIIKIHYCIRVGMCDVFEEGRHKYYFKIEHYHVVLID